MKIENKPLSDFFTFPSIKGITEQFIITHPGKIPVYGGRINESPVGFVADNLKFVKYFENCLAWNREGSIGYVFYHKHKFTTNDHHRPMILKNEYHDLLNLDYARIQIEITLLSQGFSWGKTASKQKIGDICIDIPYDNNNCIDYQAQLDYVEKYNVILETRKKLINYKIFLERTIIHFNHKYQLKEVFLGDDSFFQLSIGKRILKNNILSSGIPVYSANVNKPFGYIEKPNIESFNTDSLIWGIDGNFSWNYFTKNNIFATTDHCGRLIVKDEAILPECLFYLLRESANNYGFNRTFRASLINIRNVSVGIPIKNNKFDICAQEKIISAYKNIEMTKMKLLKLINLVIKPSVNILTI
jgi:hypothetical protein